LNKITQTRRYDTSRAQDRRRAPHTGRGSDSLVLIEGGAFYPKFYGNSFYNKSKTDNEN